MNDSPQRSRRIQTVVILHTAAAVLIALFFMRAVSATVLTLIDPTGARWADALFAVGGAVVSLLIFVLQLALISGLRRGSVLAWWTDVATGAVALCALVVLWGAQGFPGPAALLFQGLVLGGPIAAAGILLTMRPTTFRAGQPS